jgi:nitrite reductase/ring-hydroxylating ferredoxin subunit/uncharacterized membrane protein
MRSAANFNGHPIHPMLIPFPIAFFVGSWISDSICYARYDATWAIVATRLAWAGVIFAVLAAGAGAIDYFVTVPPKSSAKKRATKHALINLTVVAIYVLAEFTRLPNTVMPTSGTIVIQTLGVVMLTIAGWMGGTLAYRNQIGVDHRYADAGKQHATPARANDHVVADPHLKPGQMRLIETAGHRIVLARINTEYVAFDDRCTHRGGSLADGALIGSCVQCPWHGSQFDCTTGNVIAGPAKQPLAVYPVSVKDGKLSIQLPD